MDLNRKIENIIRTEISLSSNAELLYSLIKEKPSFFRLFSALLLNLSFIIFAFSMSIHFTSVNHFAGFIFLYVIGPIFVSTRLRSISMILHDLTHFNFSASKRVIIFLGRIISLFLPFSFDSYRYTHMLHHKYLGEPGKDPDFNYEIQMFIYHQRRAPKKSITFIVWSFVNYFRTYLGYRVWDFREPLLWRLLRIVTYVSIFCIGCIFYGYKITSILTVLIYFLYFPTIRFLGDTFDHGQLIATNFGIKTRNNVGFNRLMNFLFFPLNDQFHLVHHLYPNISYDNLQRAHQILESSSELYQLLHRSSFKDGSSEKEFIKVGEN